MKNEIIPRIYVTPYILIKQAKYLIIKYGLDEFLKLRKFKKIREKYIASCYVIGLNELEGNGYWISTENSEAPDVIAARFETCEKGRKELKLDIEVMTWTSHDSRTIARCIIEKLIKKAYPKNFRLICYIEKIGVEFVPEILYLELLKYNFNIGEIWIIFESNVNKKTHSMFQIYPNKNYVSFNTIEDENSSNDKYPVPFIKTWRGIGAEMHDLGKGFYSYEADNEEVVKIESK